MVVLLNAFRTLLLCELLNSKIFASLRALFILFRQGKPWSKVRKHEDSD